MSKITEIRVSGSTYTIEDASALHNLDLTVTSEGSNAVAGSGIYNAITAATGALAETIAQELSGKVDNDTYTAYTASTDATISGKLDTSTFETYSGNVDTALASKIAGAAWDSNTSHLNFYDNVSATGTPLTYVDGADWVKDSFLKSVTIEDKEISGETVTCLVFVFETESGETETDIPLTDIFDPDNYVSLATYTAYTAATDSVLTGKAETTAVTAINNALTAHTSDTDIHVTTSDKSTWSGKQDALVNQVNIKSINGTSLLGSGDLQVQSLPTVSGTTLIFS